MPPRASGPPSRAPWRRGSSNPAHAVSQQQGLVDVVRHQDHGRRPESGRREPRVHAQPSERVEGAERTRRGAAPGPWRPVGGSAGVGAAPGGSRGRPDRSPRTRSRRAACAPRDRLLPATAREPGPRSAFGKARRHGSGCRPAASSTWRRARRARAAPHLVGPNPRARRSGPPAPGATSSAAAGRDDDGPSSPGRYGGDRRGSEGSHRSTPHRCRARAARSFVAGSRRTGPTPARPAGPMPGIVGVARRQVLRARPTRSASSSGARAWRRRPRRVGHGVLVAARGLDERATSSGSLSSSSLVVASIGVYQSGMQSVWSMNGMVATSTPSCSSRMLVPAVEDPDEVVLVALEADPVVDVADLDRVDRSRDRRRRTRPASRRAPARAGRRSRRTSCPAGRRARAMPVVARRQQARRVVLDDRGDRDDRQALGPGGDQLLLRR